MNVRRLAFAAAAAAATAVAAGVLVPEFVTGPTHLVGPLYLVPDPRWTAASGALVGGLSTYRWLGAPFDSARYSFAVALGTGSVGFFFGFAVGAAALGRVFGTLLGLGLGVTVGALVARVLGP